MIDGKLAPWDEHSFRLYYRSSETSLKANVSLVLSASSKFNRKQMRLLKQHLVGNVLPEEKNLESLRVFLSFLFFFQMCIEECACIT